MGKNIALASQLTGLQLNLEKSEAPTAEDLFEDGDEVTRDGEVAEEDATE